MGFVGVQGEKQRQSRSPSPRPGVTHPPPSQRDGTPSRQPKPIGRVPKPDAPPPAPEMRIRPRTSSLSTGNRPTRPPAPGNKDVPNNRPPKPAVAPPPLHKGPNLPPKPVKSPDGGEKNKKLALAKSKSVSDKGWQWCCSRLNSQNFSLFLLRPPLPSLVINPVPLPFTCD